MHQSLLCAHTKTGSRGDELIHRVWDRTEAYPSVMPITPETKNWIWVLERPCTECGFDATSMDASSTGRLVRDNIEQWTSLLQHHAAAVRVSDDRWSALEYGCHVRDVFRLFDRRLRQMLTEDGAHFANWDQDATAVEENYLAQDVSIVSRELAAAGATVASTFDAVRPDQWQRTGFRSDGVAFTVERFARYFIHDPIHHVADVEQGYALLT